MLQGVNGLCFQLMQLQPLDFQAKHISPQALHRFKPGGGSGASTLFSLAHLSAAAQLFRSLPRFSVLENL